MSEDYLKILKYGRVLGCKGNTGYYCVVTDCIYKARRNHHKGKIQLRKEKVTRTDHIVGPPVPDFLGTWAAASIRKIEY